MECCRAIARWSCRRLGASLYDMASTNDAPSQDFFLVQSLPTATWVLILSQGLGTFTVNFTGPVPFGPGIDMFGSVNTPVPLLTLFGVDPNMRSPLRTELQLHVQQAIGDNTVLQAGYVGSKGTKLFRVRNINQATPGTVGTIQQRRPFNT